MVDVIHFHVFNLWNHTRLIKEPLKMNGNERRWNERQTIDRAAWQRRGGDSGGRWLYGGTAQRVVLSPGWREVPRFKTFIFNHGHKGCERETPRSGPGIPRQIHQVWLRERRQDGFLVVKQSCAWQKKKSITWNKDRNRPGFYTR